MSIFGVLFYIFSFMAASKKKTPVKKSGTSAKATSPKTVVSTTAQTKAKKTKKTVKSTPVKDSPSPKAENPTVKKSAPKKSAPKTTPKKSSKSTKKPSHFTKEIIPETSVSQPVKTDMNVFVTIVACIVVVLVLLWGYIYSRQSRINDTPVPPLGVTQPQRINISSSVLLAPDVVAALETIVTKVAIAPNEVLLSVNTVDDTSLLTSEFAQVAKAGDFIFEFQKASILYRPSLSDVVQVSPKI
jgi:hypothetical protein